MAARTTPGGITQHIAAARLTQTGPRPPAMGVRPAATPWRPDKRRPARVRDSLGQAELGAVWVHRTSTEEAEVGTASVTAKSLPGAWDPETIAPFPEPPAGMQRGPIVRAALPVWDPAEVAGSAAVGDGDENDDKSK